MVRDTLLQEVTFEYRPEGSEERDTGIPGEQLLSQRGSMCKAPEAKAHLVFKEEHTGQGGRVERGREKGGQT